MGILEALKSSEIDAEKKDAFLNAGVHLGTSSGLNEIYSVLKGIHQKDYTAEVAKLADLFSVTYDPAMIKAAVDDMITHIEGGTVTQDHVIAVSVVDAIFESCSAFGTVGLSVGVTSQLNNGAKILYMLVTSPFAEGILSNSKERRAAWNC